MNAETIVNRWTETKRSDKLEDEDFQLSRILTDLFIQFNTPVPSSAGVDRRWSSVEVLAEADRTWSSVVFLARVDGR